MKRGGAKDPAGDRLSRRGRRASRNGFLLENDEVLRKEDGQPSTRRRGAAELRVYIGIRDLLPPCS